MENRKINGRFFKYPEADFDYREKENGRAYKYYFENYGFDEINIFIRDYYGDDDNE